MQAYRADNGQERAKVDLKFHFMRETLRQYVSDLVRHPLQMTWDLECAPWTLSLSIVMTC